MRDLEGDWRVERRGGLLPPMVGVRKRIRGDRGETCVGALPCWPFRVERREGRVALVYSPPFSAIVDELWAGAGGSWLGRSTLGGRELGRFRMIPDGYDDKISEREESMTREEKLRRKLVEYVQNVHAMEQNVLLMLDSMIVTTRDARIVEILRQHKEETRRQERLLHERLKA